MKEIIINQENCEPIKVVDENIDNISNEDYLKDLSKLLQQSNVSILEIGNCSVILKPSKIQSIIVNDTEEPEETVIEEVKQIEELEEDNNEIIEEDVITDMITDDENV